MGQRQTKPEEFEPGAHIYRLIPNKQVQCFHHGIYIGDDMVIHFLGPLKSVEKKPVDSCECQKCGHRPDTNRGVVKTCLDCFLIGQRLFIAQYIWRSLIFKRKRRIYRPKPPDEVVKKANNLLKEGYGTYSLVGNNCENFATYCKCGFSFSGQVFGGSY